jgi:GT2 family glycosyltransferase
MDLTVVLCTYNRRRLLPRTLASLAAVRAPGLAWELVVVDNNSTDGTREVVEGFVREGRVAARYAFEPRQGLAHARTRGVGEARGEIVAFTDDDVAVEPGWLAGLVDAFRTTDAAAVGGKILPVWEVECPAWLTRSLWGYLALLDHGDAVRALEVPDLWGANFAVRRVMLEKYGGFDTARGRVPGRLYAGEETALLRRLLEHGERVVYTPAAVVHHWVPADRMRRSYFRRWRHDQGELEAILMGDDGPRQVLGVPFYIVRLTALAALTLLAHPRGPAGFENQLELMGFLGFVRARLRRRFGKGARRG